MDIPSFVYELGIESSAQRWRWRWDLGAEEDDTKRRSCWRNALEEELLSAGKNNDGGEQKSVHGGRRWWWSNDSVELKVHGLSVYLGINAETPLCFLIN